MSEPHVDDAGPLSAQLVTYYRDTMAAHADDAITGVCAICQVHHCQDWRFAWERLLCAGEPLDNGECLFGLSHSTSDGGR